VGVAGELDAAGIRAEATLHRFVEGGGLGLEGDVADAETVAEEGRKVGEDLFGGTGIGQFDVGARAGNEGAMDQTWTSWRARTPGTSMAAVAMASGRRSRGAPSIRIEPA